jgi:hypothetical protein
MPIDRQSLALAAGIEAAIPADAPFDLVLSALEVTMARRIKAAAGDNPHPSWAGMAAILCERHMRELLAHPGLAG